MEPEFGFLYVIMDLIQTQTRVHSLTEEQLSQPDHMKEETHTKGNVNSKLICCNTDTYWINTNIFSHQLVKYFPMLQNKIIY